MFQQLIRLKVIKETLGLDLSLEGFVERLLSIGSDAEAIWEEINRQIPGYFAKTIKKTYGISGRNESLINQYMEHLRRSKQETQNVIKEQVQDFYSQLGEFQAQFKGIEDKLLEERLNTNVSLETLSSKVDSKINALIKDHNEYM